MKTSVFRRILIILLALTLCWPLAGTGAESAADTIPAAQSEAPQSLRVRLTRFSELTRLDITLNGLYSAQVGDTELMFGRGADLTVMLKDGRLYLYYMDSRLDAGTDMTFKRHPVDAGTLNGLQFANNPSIYEGDLRVRIVEDKLQLILTVGVEDYVKGVVPYEMSDSFPLEALKAQAVAARTYAVSKALGNAGNDYDLVDNTNDQVYRGRRADNVNAEKAVDETSGVCGFYKGKLAICYYSASNGGQTELAEHEWGEDQAAGYLDMRDDPYDLANPQSKVLSVTVPKTAAAVTDMPYVLRLLLCNRLADTLTAAGYDPSPESLLVSSVSALWVDTPRFSGASRLYTMLHITFEYSARTRADALPEATLTPGEQVAPSDQEVSLFTATPSPTPTQTPTPSPTPQETPVPSTPAPTPSPTPAPSYGPFVKAAQPVTLDIPIFPDTEKWLSLSINGDDNEMFTVVESADSFSIQSRRFGHGIGLSQRGAEWMAGHDAKTYIEILSFYYPGMDLLRYPDEVPSLPTVEPALLETAGPVPTLTPRPTLMPVTQTLPYGAWYASVTGITDDSTLNLRATPDLSGQVVMRLYKNQRLIVLENCAQDGWVHVKTDATEGYVMEKFLTREIQ
jgi:hypothetical protein